MVNKVTRGALISIAAVAGLWYFVGQRLYPMLQSRAQNSSQELNIVLKMILMLGSALRTNILATIVLIVYVWGVSFSFFVTADYFRKDTERANYKVATFVLLSFFI